MSNGSAEAMTLDELTRNIEMHYEMLFAFEQAHGTDPDTDMAAAWTNARDNAKRAIARYVVERSGGTKERP